MLNILIADDNIEYARNLMHFINMTNDNVRVSDISINGKETLDILIKSTSIDIILLDLKMPYLNGIEIINQIELNHIDKYNNSFIIISGDTTLLSRSNLLKSKMIYKILSKGSESKLIINTINELIYIKQQNNKCEELKYNISNELLSIGYLLSHNGTKYLIDVIEMIYYRGEYLANNLNKYVYPIIAKRYKQTVNNIKTSITRATEAMYYNCREDKLIKYFYLTKVQKPAVKTIIITVLFKIKKK